VAPAAAAEPPEPPAPLAPVAPDVVQEQVVSLAEALLVEELRGLFDRSPFGSVGGVRAARRLFELPEYRNLIGYAGSSAAAPMVIGVPGGV